MPPFTSTTLYAAIVPKNGYTSVSFSPKFAPKGSMIRAGNLGPATRLLVDISNNKFQDYDFANTVSMTVPPYMNWRLYLSVITNQSDYISQTIQNTKKVNTTGTSPITLSNQTNQTLHEAQEIASITDGELFKIKMKLPILTLKKIHE